MEHAFNTNVAALYDVNIAVLLHNFKFWTFNNLSNNKHIHDGYCWTYNKLEAFCHLFPYWTFKQIRTIIDKCVKEGLIIKGNYNHTNYDRTCWYALTPKTYEFYPELVKKEFIMILAASEKRLLSNSSTICPFGQMEVPKWANRFALKGTPIPDTDPDTDPNINISTSDEVPNSDYTEKEKDKSDNCNNQLKDDKETTQDIECKTDPLSLINITTRLKKEQSANKEIQNASKFIQENNIFNIPSELIEDWKINRKKKRVPLTVTAWKHTNKILAQLKEKGIKPIEAFERMVAKGWQGLEIEYFQQQIDGLKVKPPQGVNESPLSKEEGALFAEFTHLCKTRIPISEKTYEKIQALKNRLSRIDHPIAREVIGKIDKLEEINAGKSFQTLSSQVIANGRHNVT